MLIQLYRDNYIETPREVLTYRIYNGYFNGTDATPAITWFNTAILLDFGETSNLSTLESATNNLFGNVDDRSLKISGYFRAKKTGTYTFFTTSDDASFLYINDIPIVLNGGTHAPQTRFGVYPMTAGTYYKFDIYYGESISGQEFSAGYYEPDITEIPSLPLTGDITTLTDVLYSGDYTLSSSSIGATITARFRAFNKSMYGEDRFESAGSLYNKTIGSFLNYYTDSGTSTTTLTNSTIYRGEWIQIELPQPIEIKHFKLGRRSSTITTSLIDLFTVFGTNDPTTGWFKLYERTSPSLTFWGSNNYEVKSFDVATNINKYKYYRLAVNRTQSNSGFGLGEFLLYTEIPTTNTTNYIKDARGLTTYYDIDPENTTSLLALTAANPLTYSDGSLQGLFRVSPLALYFNRPTFATNRHDLLYVASDDLFNNFNGTFKNYIQLHEKPVANDIERKRFTQFSSDMSFECVLDGKIEVRFKRGTDEPTAWRYAMLILDVERIPTKNI